MDKKELSENERKKWSKPALTTFGTIQELTQWLSWGSHTEIFGGQRKTPIDWGLDGS